MGKQLENQQKTRERATYRYLEALDSGDINVIAEVLQQAVYDASLEQMLLEVHQAYFQEEPQVQENIVMKEELPTAPLHLSDYERKQPQRSSPWWMRTLVAVLIVGVLIGSFVTLLTLRQSWVGRGGSVPATQQTCQPHPLQQYSIANGNSAGAQNSLQDVASLSINDAWAVGSSYSSSTSSSRSERPLIEHWDGKNWWAMPNPVIANSNSALNAVAAISAHDVWAVGRMWLTNTDSSLSSTSRTLVEHWDGKNWQIVASPNGPTGSGVFNALTVISPQDIWIAGYAEDVGTAVPQPLLEHWDGKNWQVVVAGKNNQMRSGSFSDIAAVSANDIWAVGRSVNNGDSTIRGLVEHWDGNRWQLVATPANMLTGDRVSAVSTHSVWVRGTEAKTLGNHLALIHWDGRQWVNVALPTALTGGIVYPSKMAVITDNDIWIVVNSLTGNGIGGMLLTHWDGKSWKQFKMPLLVLPVEMTKSIALGITVRNGQFWIVGYASDNDGTSLSAFILGQRTCP